MLICIMYTINAFIFGPYCTCAGTCLGNAARWYFPQLGHHFFSARYSVVTAVIWISRSCLLISWCAISSLKSLPHAGQCSNDSRTVLSGLSVSSAVCFFLFFDPLDCFGFSLDFGIFFWGLLCFSSLEGGLLEFFEFLLIRFCSSFITSFCWKSSVLSSAISRGCLSIIACCSSIM